jgi:hypothetical protein
MESSTTDTCEWCNRPMLPAGASVSGKAAKELKQSGRPLIMPPAPAVEPETGLPLDQQEQAEEAEAAEAAEAEAAPQQMGLDVTLRPLGHGQAADQPATAQATPAAPAPQRTGASHGLADSATQTSIDISQYVGADQSIFRPIKKEDGFSSAASMDRVTTQRKGAAAQGPGSDWSENDRLKRCAAAGVASGIVFALIGYFVTGSMPSKLYVLPLGSGSGLFTAIKFGIGSGLVLGVGLGAILVKLQKGSGIGMLMGLAVGYGFQAGIWGMLAGALAGIFAGRFATLGVRRVVNV